MAPEYWRNRAESQALLPLFPVIARNTRVTGSKKRSTTRSLSGMIALSVIWMSSGQTLVQHLVMLQ